LHKRKKNKQTILERSTLLYIKKKVLANLFYHSSLKRVANVCKILLYVELFTVMSSSRSTTKTGDTN